MVFILASLLVAGCGESPESGDKVAKDSQNKETIKLLYVEWACARATTHVIADVLENFMGYKVELTPVSAAAMYEGLAAGEADAMFCAWLPWTHKDYMEKVGDKIENLGPNFRGAKIGLVVPSYVEINSIEEMNSVKDKFNGQIIGIDPGAGIMKATEKAINEYGLDYELVEGSGATMTAALKQAIEKGDWVVVTGWSPHWKFARWDLKYLEDPKGCYGEEETINTIVRKGLKEDMPEVYEFFDKFYWEQKDISSAMNMAEEMGDSKAAARKWVEENMDLVNTWLPDKYQQK
ncbi:MAG: glycine betaine ABC transporter substrate-binding protein [Thermosyntropha sp.]|nr:glycine betaine ABC transporter substrate-binding protein [Thermosyntropha sp.]